MSSPIENRFVGQPWATRSESLARNAMAATSQPLATQCALEILRQGGSAVDAAIAAGALLGVVEPTGSGIGGDLFAMLWDAKERKLHGLNGSGRSPQALSLRDLQSMGLEKIPALGALSVSVPACVDGWFTLHQRFGKLPMAEVLRPAIHYAREGFPVSEVIAYEWQHHAELLRHFPNFAEIYLPGGRAPRKGEVFENPALANTLEIIAEGGRQAFYSGEIASAIVKELREQGGFMSLSDLAGQHSEWVTPVSTTYRGYEVWELPPNSQGICTLQMLNLLEAYDLPAMGRGSPEWLHLLIEAKKLAFEDRARFYADPDFARVPTEQLISKSYAEQRRKLIRRDSVLKELPPPEFGLEDGDTVYLTVADSEGNMVSLTQSNYRGMGSGITPAGLGFVLQNRGELFDLQAGRPNSYAPGKRPFHTLIPAFVTKDGEPYMSFGVMGGAMQAQGQVQILVNMIDFGLGLQEAGDAPRLRHYGSSQATGEPMSGAGRVYVENGTPEASIYRLKSLGHQLRRRMGGFGGYQAILHDTQRGVYIGASESRKDGQAAGW
ncbi:MAG: gamma-glutamyltransferase [Planctomycetota bacterium]|nr:MAG: gamma-glutamyltransferase [Planctomycetota bacterium]